MGNPAPAALVSVATGDGVGGSIIIAILALSIGLEAFQEHQALGAPKRWCPATYSRGAAASLGQNYLRYRNI
jgi:hypothetical protein